MQIIETRYHGSSNSRPARIIATQSGGVKQAVISRDSAPDDDNAAHGEAARVLAGKMDWHGEMIGGHTKDGMVWVFVEDHSPRIHLD
jgi:hypothetical protein